MTITSIRTQIEQTIQTLSEGELVQVAEYLAFLRFRARTSSQPEFDQQHIAALYAEAATDDVALAEQDLAAYAQALQDEDSADDQAR